MKFCLDGGRGGNFLPARFSARHAIPIYITLVTVPELVYRREPQIGNLRNKPASKEEINNH